MPVEFDPGSSTATIAQLNAAWPTGTDKKKQGDDHLRLTKRALKNTFPNLDAPVTVKPVEMNALAGLTVPIVDVFQGSNTQNLFLNPAFYFNDGSPIEVDQANNSYIAEQWQVVRNNSGGSFTPSWQIVDPSRSPAPGYALQYNITSPLVGSGTVALGIKQRIEDVTLTADKKLALSVWIDNRSSAERTFTASLGQYFGKGSGATPPQFTQGVEGAQVVPANSGRRLTFHFEVPSIVGRTIADPDALAGTFSEVSVVCTTTSTGAFRFQGLQLEQVATSVQPASAFSMPSLAVQGVALQRYFQAYELANTPCVASSVRLAYTNLLLSNVMRVAPTVSTFNGPWRVQQPVIGTFTASISTTATTAKASSVSVAFETTANMTLGYPALLADATIVLDARL